MRFKNTTKIKGDLQDVFELFANIIKWPEFISHVKLIEPVEMTENKQHVYMTILAGSNVEKLETFREVNIKNKLIQFRQPSPPAPLKHHTGTWLFRSCQDHVIVEDVHDLKMTHPFPFGIMSAMVAWHFFIKKNSSKTINEIKKRVENA